MPRSAVMVRNGKIGKLSEPHRKHLLSRYLLPQPRNALAEAVRTHASAAMDISDGLVGDFAKLGRVSGVAQTSTSRGCRFRTQPKPSIAADSAMLETAHHRRR